MSTYKYISWCPFCPRTHRQHYQQALILIAGSISLQLKGPEVLLSTQQRLEVGDLELGHGFSRPVSGELLARHGTAAETSVALCDRVETLVSPLSSSLVSSLPSGELATASPELEGDFCEAEKQKPAFSRILSIQQPEHSLPT